ncbi:hypothetical protein [Horticoccus sp. 23ND18S-11]|uniref:hypothetical protein n=1 Tax=Horticoccus sp. 23ND18S-11 TaxID=3391832 RepID=UPI0039C995FC
MKLPPHYLVAVATGLFAVSAVEAQIAPAASSPTPTARKDAIPAEVTPSGRTDAVMLSPFTVQSDRDTGYQATSTLAGSRLNTPIKDLGASISVYTKDFLNDIGATNANELLIYATGMEAAGPGGNFSNGAGNNITETNVVGDSVRNAPQGGTRARGLAGPTYTRGFFVSEVAIDGYNTSAVTVNRGPNAILFGVASPSGVVDTTLLQADPRRNSNRTEFRYGDNDSTRASFDFNRVLIPRKLAVRLAALDDRERYDQRPAFETKQRLYGALTFEPFRSTVIRGNFETGHTKANRPFSVLPFNSTKPWFDGDRKAFDWTFYDDPARNPSAAAQSSAGNIPGTTPAQQFRGFYIGSQQIFNTLVFPVANPTAGNGALGLGFQATPGSSPVTGTGSLTLNTIRRTVFDPVFNRDSADDGQAFYETRNIFEMPAAFFADNRVPAGLKSQGFTDFSAFDFARRQLDETGRQNDTFRNFTVSLEQRAWKDRVGVELAYFAESLERKNRNNYVSTQANANHIRIDPNLFLPDGRPNPNVGRPYVDSAQAIFNQNRREREAMRGTAYLRYDFKDVSPTLGKWLGKHTATILGERTQLDQLNVQSKLTFFGEYEGFTSVDPYGFNRLAKLVAYIGPSVIGNNNPLKLEPISSAPLTGTVRADSTFFLAPAGDPAQAKVGTVPWELRQTFRNGNYSRDVIKSKAANLMSYWFDDLVVTNVGIRRDEDYFQLFSIPTGVTPEGLANVSRVERDFNEFTLPKTPLFAAGKEVKSYSVVVRWPQKWLRLPKNMDVSVFNNISENFTPNGSNTNAYGELLPSPKGTTREYGLNFSFLDNRFNVRLNHYETKIQDANIGRIAPLSQMINNVVLQTAGAWVAEINRNPNASRQADVDLLLSPFPAGWQTLNRFAYTGSPATQNYALTFTQLPSYSDTANYVAKGTEVDVVYNPTRNWRILVNFAKNQTVQSNIAPGTRELIARMRPVLDRLANRPRLGSATGYTFPTDPVTGRVTSLDAGAGEQTVAQYVFANVDVPFASILAAEGVSSPEIRKYRVNLVTSYSFGRETFLNGFGVGTGVRWQDKVGIGYPTSYTSTGSVFIDRAKPYFAPGETNVDGWVSYSRRIWNQRIDWKVQLNVRNVIGDDQTIAITAQPDGSPAAVRLAPERRWYLSNSFSF